MNIVIIDYGAGNIKSIQFAIERLGYNAELSNSVETIRSADKVIFPGVGEASSAMKKLKESGLDTIIATLRQPVLGICLGMQLMCNHTAEGNTTGLGVFKVNVDKFQHQLKIPQIGWNTIKNLQTPLFKNIKENSYIYLVHSYYVPVCEYTVAETTYDITYSSALQHANFYGTQFHPEKSSDVGSRILQNFLELES